MYRFAQLNPRKGDMIEYFRLKIDYSIVFHLVLDWSVCGVCPGFGRREKNVAIIQF